MPARLNTRRTRRISTFRLHKPEWIDPFPGIPGTRPEKRVFEALVRRGIYFIFQGDFPVEEKKKSVLLQVALFKPDFIIPEWKVILDPFGDFAHSQPEAVFRDRWKFIYYSGLGGRGYEFIHPWSTDIENNGGDWVVNLSKRIRGPKLAELGPEDRAQRDARGFKLGENLGLGATGVAAGNRARARPKQLGLRRGRGRRRTRS